MQPGDLLEALRKRRGAPRAAYALERFLALSRASGASGRCLDAGCGAGEHIRAMKAASAFNEVHGLGLKPEGPGAGEDAYHNAPVEAFAPSAPYDAVWCCHALEHTTTPGPFLESLRRILRDDGVLGLVVPPAKGAVTVGHVTMWTPGLLLLNLVRAGFDCSEAMIRRQGYNIAVVMRVRPSAPRRDFGLDPETSWRPFLPRGLKWMQNRRTGVWYFRGEFRSLNW